MDDKAIKRMMNPLKTWRMKFGMVTQRKCPWCGEIPMAIKPIMLEKKEATVCKYCKQIYYLNFLVTDVGDIVQKFRDYKWVEL